MTRSTLRLLNILLVEDDQRRVEEILAMMYPVSGKGVWFALCQCSK
ncbi:MAG: hypothetical protein AB1568_15105 [Thermodesulfobacteriota bacterium]